MSAFLGSPPALIPRPIPKPQPSCSQTPRIPPPPPPPPPPSQQPQNPPELSSSSLPSNPNPQRPLKPRPASPAESTDWVASTLTRRFGLGAGLAWVAFLAFGVVSEQIKTRLEASQQEANTRPVEKVEETVLPNGIKYYELTVGGGGNYPRKGDLVVIDLQGRVKDSNSDPFIDTFSEGKRPLALVMGSRPYTKGMCEGIEYILSSMGAGGKRRVIVPPTMGFGDEGVDLGSGVQIPPAATLEYIVQVDKVSIAPS